MEINEYILRIIGTAAIPEALELDHDVHIDVHANVQKSELRSQNDGTFNKHISAKILTCDVTKDDGEVLRAIDKRSVSRKMRGAIRGVQIENGIDIDEEEFYQRSGKAIIANMESVLQFLKVL